MTGKIFKKMTLNKEIAASYLSLIGVLVYILLRWKSIPPKVPWFYSLPFGEDQLMNKEGLIVVVALVFFLVLTSSFLPRWVKDEDKIIEQTVSISFLLISVLLCINVLKMLQIFI